MGSGPGRVRITGLAVALALATLAGVAAARGDERGGDDGERERSERRGDEPADEERSGSRVMARGEPVEGDEATAEEPLQKLTSVRHVNNRARDMRLRETPMKRLLAIAARYHATTGSRLVVTGGYRSTRRQAELMAAKLEHGDDLGALYAERAAAVEIQDAYRAAVERGTKKSQLVTVVLDVIQAQIARGVFVSRHLQGRAADVRSRGMSEAQIDALRRAVRAEPGAVLVDERDGEAPHFHVKL